MASTAEFASEVDAATDLYDLWSVSRDLLDEGHWTLGESSGPGGWLHNQVVLESEHEGRTELVGGGGVDLFVRRFGSPALPVLIVVHGGPTWDHSYLLPAVAGLSDLAHVVLFDLRGCGRSSRTPPLDGLPVSALQPDLLADDVAALIRHYGAEQADVLGFSYGGGVAMRVVDQYPEAAARCRSR
jgi:alpha-beta hydrolase superfamily lysophospholipase